MSLENYSVVRQKIRNTNNMKSLIFHRDGIFFYKFPLPGLVSEKNTPTVTSQIPLFLGGYLSKMFGYLTTRVFEAPKMEWRMDFFVLAIARRTLMEIGAALIKKIKKKFVQN